MATSIISATCWPATRSGWDGGSWSRRPSGGTPAGHSWLCARTAPPRAWYCTCASEGAAGAVGNGESQARREAELQQQRTALRSPGAGVSEPVRAAQEDELRKKTRAVQRFVEDANRWLEDATQELREKEARETQGLLRAIPQIIRELSEREGYQLVLEGNANTAVVLSFGKAIDLTPQVIQRFDHASA